MNEYNLRQQAEKLERQLQQRKASLPQLKTQIESRVSRFKAQHEAQLALLVAEATALDTEVLELEQRVTALREQANRQAAAQADLQAAEQASKTPEAIVAGEKALCSNSAFLMRARMDDLRAYQRATVLRSNELDKAGDKTEGSKLMDLVMRADGIYNALRNRATLFEKRAADKQLEQEQRAASRRQREKDRLDRIEQDKAYVEMRAAERRCQDRRTEIDQENKQ